MKQGFWGNYELGEFFEIDEHEMWIRRSDNAARLGLAARVIARIAEFEPIRDRDRFLPFLYANAPVMRWRGHGESVTFEFNAQSWDLPLLLIGKWGKLFAGPYLHLKMVNFDHLEIRETLWKDYNGISD